MDMYTSSPNNGTGHSHPTSLVRARFFGLALMLLFTVCTAHAQTPESGGIQGRIVDKKQETPLVAHPVTLTTHRMDSPDVETEETLTDESGNYHFKDLSLDPSLYYTVSTVHEGSDYTEADIVLSSWAPTVKIDFEIGAFTDDKTQVSIRSHSFIIAPPPADHPPDGAVTIIEAVGIENRSDLPFRTPHGTQNVGLHLSLPEGTEGFQPHRSPGLKLDPATGQAVFTQPLPPGDTQLGYTYIFHVGNKQMDLSRRVNFDTAEFLFFVPEGIDFVPRAKVFGAPSREQIHNTVYLIYQSNPSEPFAAGTEVDLVLNVNMGGPQGTRAAQSSNLAQLILVAVAAALTGGFFAAAIFKLRSARTAASPDTEETSAPMDAGWLRKLSQEDREHVRITRLEFITELDAKYENQDISERVYKRLRREQTERLTTLLEEKRGNDA